MEQVTNNSAKRMVRRCAPFAVAAMLCVGAAACGSTSNVSPNNAPTTTTPGGTPTTTTPGGTPTTKAPQAGGAGF